MAGSRVQQHCICEVQEFPPRTGQSYVSQRRWPRTSPTEIKLALDTSFAELYRFYINKEIKSGEQVMLENEPACGGLGDVSSHPGVSRCHPTCSSSPALTSASCLRQVPKEHSHSTHSLVVWSSSALLSPHGLWSSTLCFILTSSLPSCSLCEL